MSYAAALVLMLLSLVLLLAGFVADASAAFVLAALASALAVILLALRVKRRQPKTFVTDAPPRARPAWLPGGNHARSRADNPLDVEVESLPVELEIDHVIDGYRSLLASEILPALETLSADELRKVVHVETNGRNRQAIVQRANNLIDLIEGKRITAADSKRSVKTRSGSRLTRRKAQAVVDPDAPEVPELGEDFETSTVKTVEAPKPRRAAKKAVKPANKLTAKTSSKSTVKRATDKRSVVSDARDEAVVESEPTVVLEAEEAKPKRSTKKRASVIDADEIAVKKTVRKPRASRTAQRKTQISAEPTTGNGDSVNAADPPTDD